MSLYAHQAKTCFEENRKLFGNPHTEPEKYNLYNGLINLAAAMEDIWRQLQILEHRVDSVRSSLKLR